MPWSPTASPPTGVGTDAHLRLDALLARPAARLGLVNRRAPLRRCPALECGPSEVYVKHNDECATLYGGGKARKLDYVLAAPRYRDAAAILGIGASGSHQLVALAVYGAARGQALEALVFDQEPSPHVRRNLAVIESHASRVWSVRSRAGLVRAWLRHRSARRQGGPLPTYLTPGASTPLGCFGHVAAALEFATQVRSGACPTPSRIFVTAGTAGTAAGLALGLALAELPVHLHLVSAVERWAFNRWAFGLKANAVLAELRARGLEAPSSARRFLRARGVEVSVDYTALGRGYGYATAQSKAATELAAGVGLTIEGTYTGKCVAAMRAYLRETEDRAPVLFWNTHASQDPMAALAAARGVRVLRGARP